MLLFVFLNNVDRFIQMLFRFIARGICHGLESRSFMVNGRYLPLCARCTGIYIGVFTALFFLCLTRRIKADKPPNTFAMALLCIGLLPLALDGVTSYLGLRETTNNIRLITGLLLGVLLPLLVTAAFHYEIDGENRHPVIKNAGEVILLWVMAAAAGFGLIYVLPSWYVVSAVPVLFVLYPYCMALALLLKRWGTETRYITVISIAAGVAFLSVASLLNPF